MYNGGPEGHEHVLLTALEVYKNVTAALKAILLESKNSWLFAILQNKTAKEH